MTEKKKPSKIAERMERMKAGMTLLPEAEVQEIERKERESQQMIAESVAEARDIITNGQHAPQQQEFVFFATDMSRTSPFFPMSANEKKERPFLRDMSWTTPWGKLSITGEKLAVYDETVLLTLLQIAQEQKSDSFLTTQNALCKRMGVRPCKSTYKAIWDSIQRMAGTRMDLEVNKNGKPSLEMTGSMISWAGKDRETGKLKVIINPYFLSMFTESFVTGIDMDFRGKLSGDVTKALYRFFQTQRPLYRDGSYSIDLLKLCVAVNLDVSKLSPSDLRKRIRAGLRELRKQGYVARWQLDKGDRVTVWKGNVKKLKNK